MASSKKERKSVTEDLLFQFREDILKILKENNGFDVIPSSAKVLVFDKKLIIKHAFLGLLDHDLKCGLIWDADECKLTDIITVTDFVRILLYFYKNSNETSIDDRSIENMPIMDCITVSKRSAKLISMDPKESLLTAVKTLHQNRIRRLPIIDSKREKLVYVLSHQRIFHFAIRRYLESESAMQTITNIRLKDFVKRGIGNFTDFTIANMDDLLIDVLSKFEKEKMSCIPLVDAATKKYCDSYTINDTRYLALERKYKGLKRMTVRQAIVFHDERKFDKIPTCQLHMKLIDFISNIIRTRYEASVCLDAEGSVVGIITLENFLDFFQSAKY